MSGSSQPLLGLRGTTSAPRHKHEFTPPRSPPHLRTRVLSPCARMHRRVGYYMLRGFPTINTMEGCQHPNSGFWTAAGSRKCNQEHGMDPGHCQAWSPRGRLINWSCSSCRVPRLSITTQCGVIPAQPQTRVVDNLFMSRIINRASIAFGNLDLQEWSNPCRITALK